MTREDIAKAIADRLRDQPGPEQFNSVTVARGFDRVGLMGRFDLLDVADALIAQFGALAVGRVKTGADRVVALPQLIDDDQGAL